ncbi:MAG TPA: hypothetical protein VFS43_47245 [Polyangiaceae bacterium]|nr:hypothetical protein [Polyangiaceae bacterium]
MPTHTLVLLVASWSLGLLALALVASALWVSIQGGGRGTAPRGRGLGRRRQAPAGARRPAAQSGARAESPGGAWGRRRAFEAAEVERGRAPASAGGEREDAWRLPPLPSGYTARLAWGFADRAGRFSYEFYRVYGPTCRLVPDLSYWVLHSCVPAGAAGEYRSDWWMNYERARELRGSELTFERFASPVGLPEELALVPRPARPTGTRP